MTYNYDVRLNNAYAFKGRYDNDPPKDKESIEKEIKDIDNKLLDINLPDKDRIKLIKRKADLLKELGNKQKEERKIDTEENPKATDPIGRIKGKINKPRQTKKLDIQA